jgi:hypothetical protein
MAADDVALAIMALKDDAVRHRVVEGDLGAVGERDLSPEEEGIVRRVAEEGFTSEVETFQTSALFVAGEYCKGRLSEPVIQQVTDAFRPLEGDDVEGHSLQAGDHCSELTSWNWISALQGDWFPAHCSPPPAQPLVDPGSLPRLQR